MAKAPKPAPGQAEIQWHRAEQLAILRDARLPSCTGSDGKRVSGATLKAVLRAIDDYGRGSEAYPAVATIAAAANCGQRTVKRAIQVLSGQLGLLIVSRRRNRHGISSNHYRIVWSDLGLLREPDQRATVAPDQGATITDQGATVAPKAPRNDLKRYEAPPPSSPSPAAGKPDWETAAAALAQQGMARWRDATAAARSSGLTACQVIEIVAAWQALNPQHRWERPLGVLYERVARGSPLWAPADHWPPPRAGYYTADASTAAKRQRTEAALSAEQEAARTERDLGPVLDAMEPAERERFAEAVLPPEQLKLYRQARDSRIFRLVLLDALKLKEEINR